MTNLSEEKKAIRRSMSLLLADFCRDKETAASASKKACAAIASLPAFAAADTLLAYMAMDSEANCRDLMERALKEGKNLALPRVQPGTSLMDFYLLHPKLPLESQLQTGAWGILEPKSTLPLFEAEKATGSVCMIVPGIAFTKDGRRLGHGKGFYDRYIARLQKSRAFLFLCGFCFSRQLLPALPCDSYDIPMNAVASEEGVMLI